MVAQTTVTVRSDIQCTFKRLASPVCWNRQQEQSKQTVESECDGSLTKQDAEALVCMAAGCSPAEKKGNCCYNVGDIITVFLFSFSTS